MKKLVVSALAVLVACPAFAGINHPSEGSSWQMWGLDPYVGMRGGMSYSNLNYKYNGHRESMTDFVFQGRAALGLEMCDTARSELEWSYFGKVSDSKKFGTDANVDVDAKMQTLLWNSYMEFGDYKMIRPFVGVGAGIAMTEVERHGYEIPRHRKEETRFSAMGTLGMTFDMESFAVDVAARYTYVDINSGMHNFAGDIGVRFMF